MEDTPQGSDPGSVEERPPEAPSAPSVGESSGNVIDRYKLLEPLGEGGMGSVWLAEQSEPIRRRVALKVIKLGMDTKAVVARFEAERQALALMDHPHVAKVFDGGATTQGRPYFVMELVRGQPITDHCDRTKLGLRDRLELFAQVCEAIQHAHHKGIIHRDIKPSNVLVQEHDKGGPLPKVIDFGIAKATGIELTQKTLFTQVAQIVGTPAYMAPEQAEMSGLDIDTRADVYSLGVLLYELLTGTTPFDVRTVLEQSYDTFLRTLREVDPAKPSTRISTLGDSATPIAQRRRSEPGILAKRLRGELDWIVLKALEKDRNRRYGTPAEFAEDVGRFLRNEAVLAAPPSALYRWSKFVRRRRATVITAAVIALLVVAGSVGTGIGWWKTARANEDLDRTLVEKDRALTRETEQRKLARENEIRALAAESEAREEAIRASEAEQRAAARALELEAVASYQEAQMRTLDAETFGLRLRELLTASVPEDQRAGFEGPLATTNFTDLGLELLESTLFAPSFDSIELEFQDQPLVLARLMQALATTTEEVGLLEFSAAPQERALELRREHLGPESEETLTSLDQRGRLRHLSGLFEESEVDFRTVLEARERLLGPLHEDTLTTVNNLAALLRHAGEYEESLALNQRAYDGFLETLGPDDALSLACAANLALLLSDAQDYEASERILGEVVEGHIRLYGENSPETFSVRGNLALVIKEQGRPEEAEQLFRELIESEKRVLGSEHPSTLIDVNNLAACLADQERLDEAHTVYLEAYEGFEKTLGSEHPNMVAMLNNMATLLMQQGRYEEAVVEQKEVLRLAGKVLGEDHPNTHMTQFTLANALVALKRYDEALGYARKSARGLEASLGPDHPMTKRARTYAEGLVEFASEPPPGD